MAVKPTASPKKPIISKFTGLPVDPKRSRAAKQAAKTRKDNAVAETKRSLRLHHKIISGGMIAAVLVLAFLGIRSQLQTYAASTSTGTFTGLGGKCLDNQHSITANHNQIQLYTCNGTNAQKWTLASDGSIHSTDGNGNYCLDIPGSSTAEYTYLQLYSCNRTNAQKFKVSNNQIISTLTGFCATVKYASTANSTRIWMKGCHGSDAQKWIYSGHTMVAPMIVGSVGGSSTGGSTGGTPVVAGSGGDSGGTGATPTGAGTVDYSSLGGSDFSSKINAAGSTRYAVLPTGTYSFRDFAYGTQGRTGTTAQGLGAYGANITKAAGILGAGSKYTTIEMVPNTSTKADYVPPESATGSANARTNQLQYILVQEPSFKIDGVKIVGTNQGHLYNGLMLNGVANATVSNMTITGVPGHDSGPPGETFMMNFYNQPVGGNATFTNVTMDGQKTAAVGIGLNSDRGTMTFRNLLTENTAYSAGVAGWQMSGTDNYYNWTNLNSVRSYNAERHTGTSNFYDPVWNQPLPGHSDINYTWESGWKGGKINFYFSSDSAWRKFESARTTIKKISIVTNPHGQGDIRSTVHVYVGGVQKTATDYVQFSGLAS
jgi:hypothetical protein